MRKWNSVAVAGIVALLALGYGMPSLVMAIEDRGRKSELKSFEIEDIALDFQNVDIVEEMAVLPDMLLNNIVVETSETFIEVKSEQRIETGIRELLQALQPAYEIEFQDLKAVYSVLMVSKEDKKVYPIWECYGMDSEKREYRFWLDDISGKVLAFKIPFEVIGASDQEFYEAMEAMGEYYGFEIYGLAESISYVHKIDSWENALMFFNEEGKNPNYLHLFKVGENLLFNMYPGNISIYDETYSESE